MKKVNGVYKCPDCGEFEWYDYFLEKDEVVISNNWNEMCKNVVDHQRNDEQRYKITVRCPQCAKYYTIHGEFD